MDESTEKGNGSEGAKSPPAVPDPLGELRRLLYVPEEAQVTRIQERLDDPEIHAEDVSRVLPEAMILRAAKDDALTQRPPADGGRGDRDFRPEEPAGPRGRALSGHGSGDPESDRERARVDGRVFQRDARAQLLGPGGQVADGSVADGETARRGDPPPHPRVPRRAGLPHPPGIRPPAPARLRDGGGCPGRGHGFRDAHGDPRLRARLVRREGRRFARHVPGRRAFRLDRAGSARDARGRDPRKRSEGAAHRLHGGDRAHSPRAGGRSAALCGGRHALRAEPAASRSVSQGAAPAEGGTGAGGAPAASRPGPARRSRRPRRRSRALGLLRRPPKSPVGNVPRAARLRAGRRRDRSRPTRREVLRGGSSGSARRGPGRAARRIGLLPRRRRERLEAVSGPDPGADRRAGPLPPRSARHRDARGAGRRSRCHRLGPESVDRRGRGPDRE